MKNNIYAFYGSLRKNEYNYLYLLAEKEGVKYITTDVISGFKLYSLGSFPTILKDTEENKVVVDIFSIDNEIIASKIRKMELGAGYTEELVKPINFGKKVKLYVGGKHHVGYPQVPNGDWVNKNK